MGSVRCRNIGVRLVPMMIRELLTPLGDSPFVKFEPRFFILPFSFLLTLSRTLYLLSSHFVEDCTESWAEHHLRVFSLEAMKEFDQIFLSLGVDRLYLIFAAFNILLFSLSIEIFSNFDHVDLHKLYITDFPDLQRIKINLHRCLSLARKLQPPVI